MWPSSALASNSTHFGQQTDKQTNKQTNKQMNEETNRKTLPPHKAQAFSAGA